MLQFNGCIIVVNSVNKNKEDNIIECTASMYI